MSNNNLEQILEMLLSEDTQAAKEALHEYVVAKAREQYEQVLAESEIFDEAQCDDKSRAYEEDLTAEDIAVEELEADMYEEDEEEEDIFPDADDEHHEVHDDEQAEDDIADKVDDLEDELEELRAEFEKLLADEHDDDSHDDDSHDDESFDDDDDESFDDQIDEESIDLEEATSFSDKVAEQPMSGAKGLKGSEADSTQSPYTEKPAETSVAGAGEPVTIDSKVTDSKVKAPTNDTLTDNIDVPSKTEKAGNSH